MVSKRRSALFSYLMLFIIISVCWLQCISAETQVKWKAGPVDKNNEAATAPKSQKYWDEHNIERPDYAKTDQEIAAEKRKKGESLSSSSVWKWILPCMMIMGAIGYRFWPIIMGGSRLGGRGHGWLSNPCSRASAEEEARQARLAKFA